MRSVRRKVSELSLSRIASSAHSHRYRPPVPGVQKVFQKQRESAKAHAMRARGERGAVREKTPLRHMRQVVCSKRQTRDALPNAHRLQAVQVLVLREAVHEKGVSGVAREDPQRGEAVRLRFLRETVQSGRAVEDPHAQPHGGAAVRLPFVR